MIACLFSVGKGRLDQNYIFFKMYFVTIVVIVIKYKKTTVHILHLTFTMSASLKVYTTSYLTCIYLI